MLRKIRTAVAVAVIALLTYGFIDFDSLESINVKRIRL